MVHDNGDAVSGAVGDGAGWMADGGDRRWGRGLGLGRRRGRGHRWGIGNMADAVGEAVSDVGDAAEMASTLLVSRRRAVQLSEQAVNCTKADDEETIAGLGGAGKACTFTVQEFEAVGLTLPERAESSTVCVWSVVKVGENPVRNATVYSGPARGVHPAGQRTGHPQRSARAHRGGAAVVRALPGELLAG